MNPNLLLTVLLLTLTITLEAQNSRERDENCDATGCVGDVKFSILEEAHFQLLHGQGWVLLAGQTLSNSDSLNQFFAPYMIARLGRKILPNAQGMFIRGADNANLSDPFLIETRRARLIGERQEDLIKAHSHNVQPNPFNTAYAHGGDNLEIGHDRRWAVGTQVTLTVQKEGENLSASSVETRPKNINLYIYIKIR